MICSDQNETLFLLLYLLCILHCYMIEVLQVLYKILVPLDINGTKCIHTVWIDAPNIVSDWLTKELICIK